MNPEIFSTIGYVSVGLWVLVPLLWVIHYIRRPRGWFCHLALICTIAAFVTAKINSTQYVNRIQEDRSAEIAKIKEAIEKERLRKEQERAEEVANKRFMEDDQGDFLDKAGMDEDEAAYYENSNVEAEWKKKKQKRVYDKDDSLEAAIGGTEEKDGMESDAIKPEEDKAIIMSPKDYEMANRLDELNLMLIKILLVTALLIIILDYLFRFNRYEESYLPLPLPARWTRQMSPLTAVCKPKKVRRKKLKQLKFLSRQGSSILYLGDDSKILKTLPDRLYRLPLKRGPVEMLPVNYHGEDLPADFVLDALWYGRCHFYVESYDEADPLLAWLIELLADRKRDRANAPVNICLFWDLEQAPPEALQKNIEKLGPDTGVTLFQSHD